MKKILKVLVTLIVCSLLSSTMIAQRSNKNGLELKPSNNINTQNETVSYSKIDAYSDGNGVFIKWGTEFELENLGFDIYRIEGKDLIKVNRNIVTGSYFQAEINKEQGGAYSFFDPNGTLSSVYQIRNMSISGRNLNSKVFYPQYENNLFKVSGSSSESLQKGSIGSNPDIINSTPVLPDDLKSAADVSNSLTDINKQWEIAAKPGVKIGVRDEGFYSVSKAELQAGGFNVNADPTLWQLYLNGIEQSINVLNNGDFIEFYGTSIDTIDSDVRVYYLIVGTEAGKRMGTTIRRPVGGTVVGRNFEFQSKKIERTIYFSNLLNGDEQNYFGTIIGGSVVSIPFNVDAIDFSTGKANVEVALQGLTFTPHRVEVTINGTTLDEITGNSRDGFSKKIGIPVGLLQNGTNSLGLRSIGGGVSLFNSVKVNYNKLYEAKQDQLSFYSRNLRVTNITGFTTDHVRVFDITYPDSPTVVTNARIEAADKFGTSYTVSLPAHRRRNMVALADSALKPAVSIKENTPSTLSLTTNQADMVIITPKEWLAEANNWATYRQNDGLNTIVVDVDDTVDEFAFGVSGHFGISEFLEHAHNNWQTAPRYVLLFGDATNDPRNYTASGDFTRMPIQFIDTLYQETSSDEALGDFDNDGLAEIAIGRIPARQTSDITAAFAKTQNFEADLVNAPARGSLCASDLPVGYDFEALCGRVHVELPPSIPTMHVNRGQTNAPTDLLNALNTGKYIANYSGHGTTNSWENVNFFSTNQVPSLSNANNLTIFLSLTCLNGYFIRPHTDSLSEALLRKTTGGAVVVWSSTGSTTPDVQEVMAKRFFNQLGNNPNMFRMGDLIKDAKSVLVGGSDVRRSWGLLGDPAFKVKVEPTS